MARKFVRNITGTQLRGSKKEPLKTNTQNDILSDGEDVFIRNQNEYHCLTDNLKRITVPEDNDTIKIVRIDKNTIEIIGNKQDLPDIPDIPEPLKLVSESEKLIVEKISENSFKLLLDLSDYYTKTETDSKIESEISEIPETDLSNFYTKSQTDSEISNAINDIPEVDLSNFYTKSQIDEQFIALEIPDVSQFLTSEQIQVLIDTAVSELDFDVDLSNYYTKEEIDDFLLFKDLYTKVEYVTFNYTNSREMRFTIIVNGIDFKDYDKASLGVKFLRVGDEDGGMATTVKQLDIKPYIIRYTLENDEIKNFMSEHVQTLTGYIHLRKNGREVFLPIPIIRDIENHYSYINP